MHAHERAILGAFSQSPEAILTTSELVRRAFNAEAKQISNDTSSNDPKTRRRGKRNKARLHRTLLYHINKLVERGALTLDHIGAHGEKAYRLAIDAGQLVIRDSEHTIAISKHETPDNFTTREEEAGIVHRRNNALHRVDAYSLNATAFPGISHLRSALPHIYAHIADVLGIIHFEAFLDQDPHVLAESLSQLIADNKDYGVAITLHIDLRKKRLTSTHQSFLHSFALQHPKRVYIIFAGSREEISRDHAILADTAKRFAENGVKFNIQDTAVQEHPILMGYAGTYVMTNDQYGALMKGNGVVVASCSATIDFGQGLSADEARKIGRRAAQTLLAWTSTQRRIAHTSLAGLSQLGSLREQLRHLTAYVRLWNVEHDEAFARLATSLHEELERFCEQERMIFGASGLPIDFRVQLSSAFLHYGDALSPRRYRKAPVNSRAGYEHQSLRMREQLSLTYAVDRIRFFREGSFSGTDLLTELLSVLRQYRVPLITYDFAELKKLISLTEYMT